MTLLLMLNKFGGFGLLMDLVLVLESCF